MPPTLAVAQTEVLLGLQLYQFTCQLNLVVRLASAAAQMFVVSGHGFGQEVTLLRRQTFA